MPHPFARYLDFANHSANATPADIEKLCASVVEHSFHAAFVNAAYITLAKKVLVGKAPVGTVVSFPLGQDTIATKVAAVNEAVQLGADELDVVPNIGTFLAGDTNGFMGEMKAVVDGARMIGKPVIVKFILDPGYMTTPEQMKQAALAIQQSGADFVKIGSGMGPRGPSVEDVAIVREAVGPQMKIKVAGGIDTYDEADAFINAGVARIGTSHAIEIVTQSRAS
ncbi:MAG: deoxyribose-phosphate aldolase [Candidatus Gottesmanbacteria bacterium]|nr:deoxyribose-phosphate aldolase [Candidatus Gottesmanbacteria bacterium]